MELTKKIASVKKDFDFNSARSCVFHHSQWDPCMESEHASIRYLIYRLSYLIVLITFITFARDCKSYLFDIFLTNWSLNLQCLYGVLFVCGILAQRLRPRFGQIDVKNSSELKVTYSDNVIDATNNEDQNDFNVAVNDERVSSPSHMTAGADSASSNMKKSDPSDNVIVTNKNNDYKDDAPNLIEKVIWILMNVTHVLPHIVAVGYWIFVYAPDPDITLCEKVRSHYIFHGATSVLALIDALVVAVPVRRTHFVFPSFVLLVYCIFSYLYEVAGGQYEINEEFIYSFLNWRHKPGLTLMFVVGGMILSPLAHTIGCWGVHQVKLKLVSLSENYRK